MKLQVEYVPRESITPYAGNAKLHPAEQIEQIKESIQEFGFNDPIAVWKNEIVEGHGRLIAAEELGIEEVPIIRLDDLTEEQRRAYALVHNKLTMNTGFDFEVLTDELAAIGEDIDLADFGFSDFELGNYGKAFEPEPYDKKVLDSYGENGLVSFNCIISCLDEGEKEWLQNLLKEEGELRRLYNCSAIMERYEENN